MADFVIAGVEGWPASPLVLLAFFAFAAGVASRTAVTPRRTPVFGGLPRQGGGPAATAQQAPAPSVTTARPDSATSSLSRPAGASSTTRQADAATASGGGPAPVQAAAPYVMLPYGSECPPDTTILAVQECLQAVSLVAGVEPLSIDKWTGSWEALPRGCSIRGKDRKNPMWHQNCASRGAGREDLAPICKTTAVNGSDRNICVLESGPVLKELPPGQVEVTIWSGGSGRLGNALVQLLHGLVFAKRVGASIIRIKDEGGRRGVRQLTYLLSGFANNEKEIKRSVDNSSLPKECLGAARAFVVRDSDFTRFAGSFWAGQNCDNIPASYVQDIAQEMVVPLFSDELRACLARPEEPDAEATLTVHLRGGDMWQLAESEELPKSGQTLDPRQEAHHWLWNNPPCPMYEKIVQDDGMTSVVVVTSKDRRHPCVQWLSELAQRKQLRFRVQNGTLVEDSCTLLRARNLALSYSTYPESIAILSSRVRRIYSRRMFQRSSPLNCKTRSGTEIIQFDMDVNEFHHAPYPKDCAGVIRYFQSMPLERIRRLPECNSCPVPC